ncbi:hypothetical protein A3I35_03660 [Candidatus Falkowbacteria bacterium RIFCSPLOWO2_02_FULL_45_15]|uniref:Uncharacterized protein n=2 Tax=Candidatus Falkowiibacteriota TaxID=1752728 RepID=A0A1F5RVW8_9BACT|nr:MAG: hypothetical protein A3D54_04075 [Candidatus Falkowbacteria bacterium RIFCSPHIGHO2_02_FULL_45_15]OGF18821.1 MAG: hypothetical protein A3I35_03660 [Candidatus Falkowbacteria bacterium RIFCSPLOWO2_02_FULL_45_15]
MHFIIGTIGMVVGALTVVYSEKIYNAFGPIPWFEKYLGTEGGSRLGYKIIGLLAFFIFMLVFLNLHQSFILWILSPIIRPMQGTIVN